MKTLIAAASVALLAGCAALAPRSYSVYVQHTSHALQHLRPGRWDYGYNAAFVAARWATRSGTGPFLTLSEGYNFSGCWHWREGHGCGALEGGPEVFEARAGWTFRPNP